MLQLKLMAFQPVPFSHPFLITLCVAARHSYATTCEQENPFVTAANPGFSLPNAPPSETITIAANALRRSRGERLSRKCRLVHHGHATKDRSKYIERRIEMEEARASAKGTKMTPTHFIVAILGMAVFALGFCRGMDFSFMNSPLGEMVMWITLIISSIIGGFWNAYDELKKGNRDWFINFISAPCVVGLMFGVFYGIGLGVSHLFA